MNDQQQSILIDNHLAISDFISREQFALKPEWEFDPVQLSHHVQLVVGLLHERIRGLEAEIQAHEEWQPQPVMTDEEHAELIAPPDDDEHCQ